MTVVFGRTVAEFWDLTLAQVDALAAEHADLHKAATGSSGKGAPKEQGTADDLMALYHMQG